MIEREATRCTNLSLHKESQINVKPTHFPFVCLPTQVSSQSYLLLLSALQVPPLLCYMAEVHLVHGHLDVADGIMFGEAVKIVHRHYQRLSTELYVGDLRRMATVTGEKGLIKGAYSIYFLHKSYTWMAHPICPILTIAEVYEDIQVVHEFAKNPHVCLTEYISSTTRFYSKRTGLK